MEPSSPIETKRLPDKANGNYIWKEVDSTHNTECIDGIKRECGSIRITPSLLDVVEIPLPKKHLGKTINDINLDPFLGFDDFGLVFYIETDIDSINSNIWSRNPISEFLPADQAKKIEDDLIGLCLVNEKLDACLFKRNSENSKVYIYDLKSDELLGYRDIRKIKFFDVPDDILLDNIPDDYISRLVSREI